MNKKSEKQYTIKLGIFCLSILLFSIFLTSNVLSIEDYSNEVSLESGDNSGFITARIVDETEDNGTEDNEVEENNSVTKESEKINIWNKIKNFFNSVF